VAARVLRSAYLLVSARRVIIETGDMFQVDIKTRLPSNLRPTTRVIISGHVTKMTVTPFIRHIQKPHAMHKLHDSMFYRAGVIADRSFTLRE